MRLPRVALRKRVSSNRGGKALSERASCSLKVRAGCGDAPGVHGCFELGMSGSISDWLERPLNTACRREARSRSGSQLIEYVGGPQGITDTHKDRLNNDLLAFVKK